MIAHLVFFLHGFKLIESFKMAAVRQIILEETDFNKRTTSKIKSTVL